MDRVNCTMEEFVKTLTNSVTVKLFSPLGGPPRTIRVYKLLGEYVSVFERPLSEPALPPLAQPLTAPAPAEPPTAPALAPRNPPTAPPAASQTGFGRQTLSLPPRTTPT